MSRDDPEPLAPAPADLQRRVDPATADAYLDRLDRADPDGATRLALDLLDAGCSVADVLVDLVAVAQREVGLRWLTGRWSVAEEQAATHVSELAVGALAERPHSGDYLRLTTAALDRA